MFKHFLITRFNLRAEYWDLTKNNEQLLTDEWMDNRMWLFDNFCFPSVVGQSNQEFEWIIYFDTNTKDVYKNRILKLVAGQPNFKVFFVNAMPSFMPELLSYIAQETKDKKYLITTRIDNDDSIHVDFINEIQKQFNQQDYRAIDFIKGYSLQIEPRYILGKKEQLFNPFISLIEKNENPKSAFHQDHRYWKRDKSVTQLGHKRLWIAIIHNRNKVNKFDGYGFMKWENIKMDFNISEAAEKLIAEKTINHRDWFFTNLKNHFNQTFELNFKLLKRRLGLYSAKKIK